MAKRQVEVSQAQALAAVIEGQGEWNWRSAVRQIAARLPLHTLAKVDAIASVAKKSRNQMLEHLLSVGIDETLQHVSGEKLEAIEEQMQAQLSRFIEEGGNTSGGDE